MLTVEVEINDTVAPALVECLKLLEDKTPLHARMAAAAEVLTRRHILEVAEPTRHKTARRLGASPTGYLSRRGNAIESSFSAEEAKVLLGGEAEIFRRVEGPVTIKPISTGYLTIPASALAYGKRAREIQGLKFVKLGRSAALAHVDEGEDGKKKMTVHYWLKKSVTLPEDKGLLPTGEQYLIAAEQGAQETIGAILAPATSPAT